LKKNLIYITGNDSYGIELEVTRWLGHFRNKFGDINIDRYDLGDKDSMRWIGDMILMSGLFVEKRLFMLRGGRDRRSKAEGMEKMLTEKITNIPDDHFLLFHNISDKEDALIGWLTKNADIRKIDTIWDQVVWRGRYPDIDPQWITLILRTYRDAEWLREKWDTAPLLGHSIAHTMEMVSLRILNKGIETSTVSNNISEKEIINLCQGYTGDTIFALSDAITMLDIPLAIDIVKRISTISRVDEWWWWLIGSIRNILYIQSLRGSGLSESEVATLLQIHPYVLKKWYRVHIPLLALRELYEKLITTSIAYKRGRWMKESELWRILAIELALLDLQKYRNR
jgi:hypothetical protein